MLYCVSPALRARPPGARLGTIKVLLLCECEAETQQFSVCLAAASDALARRSADVSDNQSRRRPKRDHRLRQLPPNEIHQVGGKSTNTHTQLCGLTFPPMPQRETRIRSDYIRLNIRSVFIHLSSLDRIVCVHVRDGNLMKTL